MKISGEKKKVQWSILIFFFIIEYVQWKYIFLNNTTVCVSYVKPVKQITFLWHSIDNRAVFTWLSKGIGFGFGFTTPFVWLVYLLWFWFYDSQVKTALTSAVITKDYPSWQAFEREEKGRFGKGSFRRERNARGAWSRPLIPFLFPFPFERLPRRLTKDRLKVISLSTSS